MYLGEDGGFYVMPATGTTSPAVRYAAPLRVIDIRDIWPVANGKDDACWVASDQGLDYEPSCSRQSYHYNDAVVSAHTSIGLARRFTVSPDGRTLMVSLQDFNSHVTFDGGATWEQSRAYLYEDGFNELRPGNPHVCYAYDEAWGIRISTDGCRTYARPQREQRKIFPSRLMTTPIAFDPSNPLSMIFLAGPDLGTTDGAGAYRSLDGGKTFHQLAWPFREPGSIAVETKAGTHMVVSDIRRTGETLASSISVTTDGGTTWKTSTGVPPTAFWYALTISPVDGNVVLASSIDASNNVFVLRSTNGGLSFRRLGNLTNAPLVRGRIDHDDAAGPAQAFVYSPEREIRYDQDVTSGRAPVVVTTLRGAFISGDDGSTWRRLDTATIAHSFWGIRWRNGYLYLGSDGQGVLKSNAPVVTAR
jgi:hypothetical protein